MIHELLKQILIMSFGIFLGTFSLIITPLAPDLWHTLLGVGVGVLCYVGVWMNYRDARDIAKGIDKVFTLTLKDMNTLTKILKSALSENEPADEHEDIGQPV